MTEWVSLIAAVLGGVVAAGMAFYFWGRRIERRSVRPARGSCWPRKKS